MRIALGARRVRLVQTLLAEALVLGALSAAGGVALTLAVIPLLNALTLTGQLPLRLTIAPDAWLIGLRGAVGAGDDPDVRSGAGPARDASERLG